MLKTIIIIILFVIIILIILWKTGVLGELFKGIGKAIDKDYITLNLISIVEGYSKFTITYYDQKAGKINTSVEWLGEYVETNALSLVNNGILSITQYNKLLSTMRNFIHVYRVSEGLYALSYYNQRVDALGTHGKYGKTISVLRSELGLLYNNGNITATQRDKALAQLETL